MCKCGPLRLYQVPAVQLVALTAHYLYWSCFGHFAVLPLDDVAQEGLFVALTRCQLHLEDLMKHPAHVLQYASFFVPLSLDALHAGVRNCFFTAYPDWFNSEHGLPSLKRLRTLTDALFDPNFRLTSLQEKAHIPSQYRSRLLETATSTKMQDFFHSTSAYVRTMFPKPASLGVRRMFLRAKQDHDWDQPQIPLVRTRTSTNPPIDSVSARSAVATPVTPSAARPGTQSTRTTPQPKSRPATGVSVSSVPPTPVPALAFEPVASPAPASDRLSQSHASTPVPRSMAPRFGGALLSLHVCDVLSCHAATIACFVTHHCV